MADLIKFLQSKGTNSNCTVCGKNSWTVPSDATQASVPIHQTGGNFVLPPPSIAAHILVCMNCGHIVLFASVIVDANG